MIKGVRVNFPKVSFDEERILRKEALLSPEQWSRLDEILDFMTVNRSGGKWVFAAQEIDRMLAFERRVEYGLRPTKTQISCLTRLYSKLLFVPAEDKETARRSAQGNSDMRSAVR